MLPEDLGPCINSCYEGKDGEEALEHVDALVLAAVRADVWLEESVVHEEVGQECVEEDHDEAHDCGQAQRRDVVGDGSDHQSETPRPFLGERRLR